MTSPALAAIRVEGSSVPTILPNSRRPRYDFYLRNRAQGEALGGSVRQARRSLFWFPGLSGLADLSNVTPGVNRSAEFLTFRRIASISQPEMLTRKWLDGAELVVVRTTNAGTVERALQIEDFRWPAPGKQ